MNWADIAERAIKTAVQTFLATASVQAVATGDLTVLRGAVTAAVAAGVSVIWNALQRWLSE